MFRIMKSEMLFKLSLLSSYIKQPYEIRRTTDTCQTRIASLTELSDVFFIDQELEN